MSKKQKPSVRETLARVFAATPPDVLAERLAARDARRHRVELRVSASEKKTIEGLARRLDVSVTQLLVNLAELAAEALSRDDPGGV